MLIYAMAPNKDNAMTIGCTEWLPRTFAEMSQTEVISVCRPHQQSKQKEFDAYLDIVGNENTIVMQESDLPESCKRRKGFWEEAFNERRKQRK